MANVVPPQSTPPPQTTSVTVNQTAVAQDPAIEYFRLPVGTALAAQVTSQTTRLNFFEAQTSLGKLLLQSPFQFKQDDQIQLILQNKHPQLQFLVKAEAPNNLVGADRSFQNISQGELNRSLTGGQLSSSNLTAVSPHTPQQSHGVGKILNETVRLDIGATVRATVLSTPRKTDVSEPGISAAKQDNLQSSRNLLHNLSKKLINRFTSEPSKSREVPSNQLNISLSTGSTFELKILEIISNTVAPSEPMPLFEPGQVFQGTVDTKLPSGHPIVDSPPGRLVLETTALLETGSKLSLEIMSLPDQKTFYSFHGSKLGTVLIAKEFPALHDTLEYYDKLPFHVRQEAAPPPVPRADGQLTSTLLFFLSALKGGSTNNWLPEKTQSLLSTERPDLLARLSDEFSQISRPFNESSSSDWRTVLIPLLGGMGLENFQLSLRGGKRSAEEGKEEDARFIVDVSLSELGRVQLDGLVKSEKNLFDLYVRSHSPFPKSMKRDINEIFSDFVEVSGVSGNLVFQAGNHFVDVPLSQLDTGTNHLVV